MEALGLALNLAPFIIEFLKVNPEPIHALKAVPKGSAKEMMGEFYINLHFEVTMLSKTLTELVDELSVEVELKERLKNEKSLDQAIWRSPPPELQAELMRRLGQFYDIFVHTMEKILKLMGKLVDDKSLPVPLAADGVRDYENSPYAKLELFFDTRMTIRRRLKFGWKKDKRDKVMGGFAKYNKRLEDMLRRSSHSNPGASFTRPKRASLTTCLPHLGLRQQMASLRKAIGRAWCQCMGKHELRLGLSTRWESPDRVGLNMIINLSNDSTKWHWGESNIGLHLDEKRLSKLDTDFPIDDPALRAHRRSSSNFTGSTLVSSPQNSPLGLFQGASFRKSSINTLIEQEQEDRDELEDNTGSFGMFHGKYFVVEDFCRTVQKAQRVRKASQLIFYEDQLSHNATTIEADLPHERIAHPGRSLESCLQGKNLNMKDRKILQVLLAQSVLFYPWEGHCLSKSSIAFHHDMTKPFATFLPDHDDEPGVFGAPQEIEPEDFKPYNNETLAALATVLLEIELQRPIEGLREEQDVGDGDSNQIVTNFWTTTRVLKDEEFNMFQGCYGAIDACLRCDFDGDSATLNDANILQQVYEQIVHPLEQELETGFSVRMPFFGDMDESKNKAPAVSKTEIFAGGLRKAGQKTVKISDDKQPLSTENLAFKIRKSVKIDDALSKNYEETDFKKPGRMETTTILSSLAPTY